MNEADATHTGVRCKLTFLEDFPRTSASIINTAALSHAARSEIRNSNYSREIEKKGEKREREGGRGGGRRKGAAAQTEALNAANQTRRGKTQSDKKPNAQIFV